MIPYGRRLGYEKIIIWRTSLLNVRTLAIFVATLSGHAFLGQNLNFKQEMDSSRLCMELSYLPIFGYLLSTTINDCRKANNTINTV